MVISHCHETVDTHSLTTPSWSKLRSVALGLYEQLGESELAIQKISDQTTESLNGNPEVEFLKQRYARDLIQVTISKSPSIYGLDHNPQLKVALHIAPPYHVIPTHLHPGSLSIIYVLTGKLRIKHHSLINDDIPFHSELRPGQASVALRRLRNIHQINVLAKPCMFLSIRIKGPTTNKVKTQKLLPVTLLSGILAISCGYSESQEAYTTTNQLANLTHISNTDAAVNLAHQLRKGEGIDQDFYEAAQLYKYAAIQGNAEAQYWLGVMYLEGWGITENSDEALLWVDAASNQNYPPAKKLLKHLLNTDEVLDC